ncbi:MAG: HAD-IIIA family hydrolase [Saprospiraceae bacterium]|nr:HAD-IIIA family hydrolase [Saprospiraceae bacterium]
MNVFDKLDNVKGIILDIDGVFTDNSILVNDQGEFLRIMNVRDGYAIKRAISAGIKVGVISGGKSIGIIHRMKILGIQEIFLGIEDKISVFNKILESWKIDKNNIMYMGDDIPDLECLKEAGLAVCPKDAVPEVLEVADYVTEQEGGKGCIRQIIEHILQSQNKW